MWVDFYPEAFHFNNLYVFFKNLFLWQVLPSCDSKDTNGYIIKGLPFPQLRASPLHWRQVPFIGNPLVIFMHLQPRWTFGLLVLSPSHFSNSLLSISTALVWLLRCFGLLPAFYFRLHLSSPLFSQSSFSTFLCESSYTGRSPPEILVVSGALRNSSVAPCTSLSCIWPTIVLDYHPTPALNYGPFMKIWWKFMVSSRTTHHFACTSLYMDPKLRISAVIQNCLSLLAHA